MSSSSRVRYRVVGFMLALGAVTYLDRACIATLAPDIRRDLGLSKDEMSWIYSAFAIAYAAFEIPTAWWADRMGTRRVLTRIVTWWSAFTMATAAAWSFSSLLVIRFLFGAGEAGAWPNMARTFSRWIPRSERGTIQGIFFAAAHATGGLTPLIALAVAGLCGWRWTFVIFGIPGIVWAIAWHRWFRDDPEQHPAVSPAELAKIVAGRDQSTEHHEGWAYWKQLLEHRNTLPLCLMYFPNSFGFYFCITWLPDYLREQHGFESMRLGFFTGLPLLLSPVADLLGGVTTDAVTRRYGLRIGRVGVGAASYLVAGGAMLLATTTAHPELAAWCIATAVAASMFTLGASWGTVIDVGGSHTGVVGAAMNTSGQIGSIACPLIVIWLQQHYDWNAPLYLIGGLFLVGAVAWGFINPHRKIFE
jgi:ACS family glucarate transporter-like MFS transporter|uniref:MFS transporter n=1 Tax=Prosthecobacter sp. TaxID=1965333 RepID=UPI003782DDE7